jgi:hypothetical protein
MLDRSKLPFSRNSKSGTPQADNQLAANGLNAALSAKPSYWTEWDRFHRA